LGAIVGATIILADDEPILRAIYAESLRRAGYDVLEVADGRETLDAIAVCHPALLLLDAWMPVLNGFEVLDALRHNPLASSLKVVMLSNLRDSDSRLEGFSGGLADWWVKGLGLDELIDRVRQVLSDEPIAPQRLGGS
jgi:DNA-binding response OmpR family regulator